MKKYKFFIDFDKEEKWLNEMAKNGFKLVGKSWIGYKFEKTKPEDIKVKIDFRKFKKKTDFLDYCTLFEDSGWKHIAGHKNSGSQYFKKINQDQDDDIFSDTLSKAGKYKRLSQFFIELAICYIPILVALLSTGAINLNAWYNPKLLYLTPDLWELTGDSFWDAFLFETPFALLRGLTWLLFPIMIIFYLYFAFKANNLYEKNKR